MTRASTSLGTDAPSGVKRFVCKNPRSFDCDSSGELGDLVRKSFRRWRWRAFPTCVSSRSSGAALCAEELRLDERFRNGRAIDRDGWIRRACRRVVNRARDGALSSSCFTEHENRDVRRSCNVRERERACDRARATDDVRRGHARANFRRRVFNHGARVLRRSLPRGTPKWNETLRARLDDANFALVERSGTFFVRDVKRAQSRRSARRPRLRCVQFARFYSSQIAGRRAPTRSPRFFPTRSSPRRFLATRPARSSDRICACSDASHPTNAIVMFDAWRMATAPFVAEARSITTASARRGAHRDRRVRRAR